MSAQFLIIWTIIAVLPSSICVFILWREYKKNQALKAEISRVQSEEFRVQSGEMAKQEASKTIHSAIDKAGTIVTAAETEALKIAETAKQSTARFETDLDQKLQEEAAQAINAYKNYLSQLGNTSNMAQQEAVNTLKTRLNELLLKLDQNMTEFFAESQQKSTEALTLEIRSARQLIDNYKQQQLQIIDENIVAVLERTLSLVLNKKLTLNDQMDLVMEGLEKAKIEKFFV